MADEFAIVRFALWAVAFGRSGIDAVDGSSTGTRVPRSGRRVNWGACRGRTKISRGIFVSTSLVSSHCGLS